MANHSIILVWEIPVTEEPGTLVHEVWSQKESDMTALMSMHTHMLIKGIVSYALNRAKTGELKFT